MTNSVFASEQAYKSTVNLLISVAVESRESGGRTLLFCALDVISESPVRKQTPAALCFVLERGLENIKTPLSPQKVSK